VRRVDPQKLLRLYRYNALGIYDEDLIDEIGSILFIQVQHILRYLKALAGEVDCTKCGAPVVRLSKIRQSSRAGSSAESYCKNCGDRQDWWTVKETLREAPRCLSCGKALVLRHARAVLDCESCGNSTSWRKFRRSVSARVWLPCPECGEKIRKPLADDASRRADGPTKLQRIKNEPLVCRACGNSFSWNSWRRGYSGGERIRITGNPRPLERFCSAWPRSTTPAKRMILIDTLVHAIHARGSVAPLFLDCDEAVAKDLLDTIATM
jgi:predicted RNA-binding Zn-ribbon protein involved in translation (DUF1610 family)